MSIRPHFLLLGVLLCGSASFAKPGPAAAGKSEAGARAQTVTLTLEEAYDRALSTDQAMQIAFLEVMKSDLLPLSAATRVGPRLIGSYSYNRSGRTVRNADYFRSHTGTGEALLTLQQPIIDFSVFPARRRGKLQAESSRLAHRFTVRETLYGVTRAYFEVLKQEKLLLVNQESLQLAHEQESLARKRSDVGEVTRADVLRAQVSVEAALRTLITSENNLELQRNTLRNILNLSPDTPLRLVEPAPYKQNATSFEELYVTALQHREDLQEKALAIRSAEESRKETLAGYAPKVVLEGSTSVSQVSGAASVQRQTGWDANITVQMPFFTGGQREVDLAASKHVIGQAKLEQESQEKLVEADVKQAWLSVQTLEGSLRAVRVQVQAAAQSYTDLQHQYTAGTANSVDVQSALKDLISARSDLAALTLDYQVALRGLEQAAGVFQDERVQRAVKR